MKGKKRFIIWMFPFFAAFLFLLWQGKNLVMEEKEEQQIWQVWAELPEGEITEKILKSMKKFPGVERLWTVLETEISVSVKEYRGSSSLQGVDLKDYPLTVIQSAGKKNLGNIPLLAVGEDFFQQLQDVGENPVSKRQQVILRENLSSLVVEIQVLPEGEQEEEAESIPGEFLGVVKERGIYMEQEQMRQWLENQGIHRGEVRLFYGMFKLVNGGFGFEVMSKTAMDAYAREYSKAFDSSFSPWKNNYIGMAKKTVIKQALKYAPLKTDFRKALSNDETIKKELSEDMSEIHGEEIWEAEYREAMA